MADKTPGRDAFLPVSRADMEARGRYYCDFLLMTGDAYVDHPSFGTAVISRVLENAGYKVAILSQPDINDIAAVKSFGRPRYAYLINSGNVDSMVANYTVNKKRRDKDAYSPGGMPGRRPDRAVTVYSNLARRAFPDVPVVIGGIESSLRRFAHYDYWDNRVRRSILEDSGADLLIYGMGERAILETAAALKRGKPDFSKIRGVCYLSKTPETPFESVTLPSFEEIKGGGQAYMKAALLEENEQDFIRGRALIQKSGERYLIQNPPQKPLGTEELDALYRLPFAYYYHPDYEAAGGVPAIEEVRFSITHDRGCFGGCNFCALALHQGRCVTSRSHASVIEEAKRMTAFPDFKGYIHDVGGPTANFRGAPCKKQETRGACADRKCLFPTLCPNADCDHSDYLELLRKLRALPGVKKVFIRSGIRYDYLLGDKSGFFEELVREHVSGQLRVAPEHISKNVLKYMGKPFFDVYERFEKRFYKLSEAAGKKQYLVPYLISSHPGSTLSDAIELASYLRRKKITPQQVQDFYPTPGTVSTAMYFTGLDTDLKPLFVARTFEEKQMQRALLQSHAPQNYDLVRRALIRAGREDLIGSGENCLIRSAPPKRGRGR
ncbi:MAG: YgiQ family radical SAM protein [Clostridia bacterium]|nr:YgiQ family radical SAM protein [Clostridia bacterium]